MTTTEVKTRFAPSPTGYLHVGNARVALLNWLFARAAGGRFLLRLDDTDDERSTEAFADAIGADLSWLGIDWDDFARQSDRTASYERAITALKGAGRLYPCYETPEELALKRKALLAAGRPPIYDRSALALTPEQKEKLEAEGRRPHWRFRLQDGGIEWRDLARGPVHFEAAALSDPVLIREDGRLLYTLASCVDDAELGISHVIRGEDHVSNTAVQVQIFEALDAAVPAFAHLPLITGAGGASLSKREGSQSLRELRAQGIEPQTLAAALAYLGSADAPPAVRRAEDLVEGFDLGRFGRATPTFDPAELTALNARVLHALPFQDVAARLPEGADERFWTAIHQNLVRFDEVGIWWAVCRGTIEVPPGDAEFLTAAIGLLPYAPWDETTWQQWTWAIKTATGAKGRNLFQPLRLALTGLDHGPELKALLPLIGRERALARLEQARGGG